MDWLILDISNTLKSCGHTGGAGGHITIKSDGEPTILALKKAVMQLHGGVCVPEQPAKGETAENGRVEESGKTIHQLFCTLHARIERGVDDEIPLDADIIPWVVRWAAICYSRYKVGQDGLTSYERLRKRSCRAIVVADGETVWYKELGDSNDRKNKAATEWNKGI